MKKTPELKHLKVKSELVFSLNERSCIAKTRETDLIINRNKKVFK